MGYESGHWHFRRVYVKVFGALDEFMPSLFGIFQLEFGLLFACSTLCEVLLIIINLLVSLADVPPDASLSFEGTSIIKDYKFTLSEHQLVIHVLLDTIIVWIVPLVFKIWLR